MIRPSTDVGVLQSRGAHLLSTSIQPLRLKTSVVRTIQSTRGKTEQSKSPADKKLIFYWDGEEELTKFVDGLNMDVGKERN